jgi:hypothetical protein
MSEKLGMVFMFLLVIAVGMGGLYQLFTVGAILNVKGGTHLPPIFDLLTCVGLVLGGGYGVYHQWPWRKRSKDYKDGS